MQRDGVAWILFVLDHLDEKSLATGHIESVNETLKGAEADEFRNIDMAGESEYGERERLQHREILSDNQDATTIEAVNPYACERSDEKSGNLSREGDDAEKQRRPGEFVNEPTGGDARHPGADERNALSGEKQAVIAMTQCAPNPSNARWISGWTNCCAGGFAQLLFLPFPRTS